MAHLPRATRPLARVAAAACALLLLGACGGGRLLDDGEYLVRKNRLELAKGSSVDNWRAYSGELFAQLSPQPNGRFLFFFRRERFYLRREQRGDTTRYGAFVREILAEEPAYLDTAEIAASVSRVRTFMLNRGYFEAQVRAEVDTTGAHAARVTYVVTPGPAYRYDTVAYEVDNPEIAALVTQTASQRLLESGLRVDARDYDREVTRLVSLMRDNGFASFYANSIAPLEADSAGRKVNATLRILPPAEQPRHRRFTIGDVTVFPDVDPLATATTVTIDTSYDGLRVIYEGEEMRVEPDALAANIFLRPGQEFNQSAVAKTNLQLNQLGVFRLVNVQQAPRPDSSGVIDVLVQLTPAPRRSFSADPSVNFSDRPAAGGQLFGVQAALSYANNNLAGGAERLTLSGDVGVDFAPARLVRDSGRVVNNFETGRSAGLELPRFVDALGVYRGLNGFNTRRSDAGEPEPFLSDAFYEALRDRATTSFNLSARYVDLFDFYRTSTLSGTFGYRLTKGQERYAIDHVGLTYFRLDAGPGFEIVREAQPILEQSLGNQVFSAFLLRSVSYARVDPTGPWGGKWTYLVDFEQSGAEVLAVNALANALTEREGAFVIGRGLDYARYGRLAVSVSEESPLGLRQSVAWRVATGAAVPFGYDRATVDVPYVRQFFGGGANSLRGWNARAVGPGGYQDTTALERSLQGGIPFQQADFRLEANVELRGPLTRIATTQLDYALFVDAGNVWTLRQDPSRPLSQLSIRERRAESGQLLTEPFWRQVAINTGFGLRYDIQFVLIRFDVGVKLRNPFPIDGTHWPADFTSAYRSRFNIGIGLNYPF